MRMSFRTQSCLTYHSWYSRIGTSVALPLVHIIFMLVRTRHWMGFPYIGLILEDKFHAHSYTMASLVTFGLVLGVSTSKNKILSYKQWLQQAHCGCCIEWKPICWQSKKIQALSGLLLSLTLESVKNIVGFDVVYNYSLSS